jgi:hypothetical protein
LGVTAKVGTYTYISIPPFFLNQKLLNMEEGDIAELIELLDEVMGVLVVDILVAESMGKKSMNKYKKLYIKYKKIKNAL